jgi:hypothetical protein
MSKHKWYIDVFDSAGDLRGKKRTYEAVKERVIAAGRFSIFEATNSDRDIAIFSQLERDKELVITRLGYPWIGVERRTPAPPAASTSDATTTDVAARRTKD